MILDPENDIVKQCASGMELEGEGKHDEAHSVFQEAWDKSSDNIEKFISAHYLARHQNAPADKLRWDQTALEHALRINDDSVKAYYPSLYLNVAKCYEDMGNIDLAKLNYRLASQFVAFLPEDGYGNMIRLGIRKGLDR